MALPTFDEGFFQVTALSFSPSVVAVGETATMSITIKNVSGKSITKSYVYQDGRYPSTNYQYGGAFPTQFLYGGGGSSGWDMKTISWANNASHTFTATVSFKEGYYQLDTSNYVLDPTKTYIAISVVTNATFSSGGNYDNLYIRADGSYLRILSARDNPKLTLEIERTPNDEAIAVKTTAKLTADVASSVLTAHGYSIKLTATNAHNPALPTDTAVTFNATLSQLITGITNSTSAVTATFSAATDWYFLLTVSNGYETTNAYGSIPRAFANIHLAGLSTGGVAFGKFSGSTQGKPLFECEFPAYFNAGIASHEYHNGDVVTINGGTFMGYVTGSTKAIHFVIPLRKSLERINSATLTQLKANISNNGGYAITSSNVSGGSNYIVSSVTRSVSVDKVRNVLEVYLYRSTAWDLTNNDALSVRNDTISITLNE